MFNADWTVILCQKEGLKSYYRNFKKVFRTENELLKKIRYVQVHTKLLFLLMGLPYYESNCMS